MLPRVLLSALAFAPLAAALAGCGRGAGPAAGPHSSSRGAAQAGAYRDVAAEAGLDYRWGHGGRSPLDIQETIGHGCAFLDYDQDGLMDVLFVGDDHCALYHNLGGGRFADVTAQSGLDVHGKLCGVAVGDYDNDGYPDVYITGYGVCALYHNRAKNDERRTTSDRGPAASSSVGRHSPVFEDVTARAGVGARGPYDFVTAAAFVDLDNDGRLDLVAGRYIQFTPQSQRFCDFNGIQASCRVTMYDPAAPVVYRNNGDGTFTDVTKAWGFGTLHGRCLGLGIAASDTGQGVAVYAANDEMPADLMVRRGGVYVNIGTASGTAFGREGMPQAGMGCDWGDFNSDGLMDLVVATFEGEPKSLYRCDAPGRFTDVAAPMGLNFGTLPYIAWTAKFVDYDSDGWPDLFITNGHVQANAEQVEPGRTYAQPMQLFHSEAGKLYRAAGEAAGPAFAAPIVGRGAAVGDFDNDGRPDLLVVNEEGPALLLHNEAKTANHWLGVRLVGKRCNRDGIGARVLVTAGGRTRVRDEQLCGGYVSAQDPRLLFGLGAVGTVDRIEVRWPDGHRDVITAPDARLVVDQYVTIGEGGSARPTGREPLRQ